MSRGLPDLLDARSLSWAFLAIAVLLGVYARFSGLHLWSVALDEYHSIMGVRFILDHGVPEFPNGGYYVRGILPSYLAAAIASIGLANETTAYRLVSAVLSLTALPPLYWLGRSAAGRNAAKIVVGLFLLSVLEIETARYARMYGPFQALFLWHLWCLRQTLYQPDRRPYIMGMISLSAIGPLIFEGAVFLGLVFFLPLLVRPTFYAARHLVLGVLTLLGGLAYALIDWRGIGVPDTLAEGASSAVGVGAPGALEVLLPRTFSTLSLAADLYLLCMLAGIVVAAWLLTKSVRRDAIPWTLGCVAVSAIPLSFAHQVAFAALVALFVICFGRATGLTTRSLLRPVVLTILVATALWAPVFLVRADAETVYGLIRAGYMTFFSHPDIVRTLVRPWMAQQPITTAILTLLSVGGATLALLRVYRVERDYFFLLAVFVALLVLFASAGTHYYHSRYSLFLYPVWILLAVAPLTWLYAAIARRVSRTVATLGAAVGVTAGMALADDISLAHIATVSSYESAFRMTPASARQRERLDYESVGVFIEALPLEASIISTERKVAFYTDRIGLTFFDVQSPEFRSTTTLGGTREVWTDLPVVSTAEQLWAAVDDMSSPVFVVYRGDAYADVNPVERALADRAGEIVHRSPDRSMIVKRLK